MQVAQLAQVGTYLYLKPQTTVHDIAYPHDSGFDLRKLDFCPRFPAAVCQCCCFPCHNACSLPELCLPTDLGLACVPCQSTCVGSARIPYSRFGLHPLSQCLCFPYLCPLLHVLSSSRSALPALPDFPNCNLDVWVATMGDISHSPTKFGDALIVMYHRNLYLICHRSTLCFYFVPWHSHVMPSLKSRPCGP